jgi:hypothetical protein
MLILMAHSRKAVRRDRLERANELLTSREPFAALGEAARTRIIHQQNLIVEFEPERALATLPVLLRDPQERERAMKDLAYVSGPRREMSADTIAMQDRIRQVLEVPALPGVQEAGTGKALIPVEAP